MRGILKMNLFLFVRALILQDHTHKPIKISAHIRKNTKIILNSMIYSGGPFIIH